MTVPASVAEGQSVPRLQAAGHAGSTQLALTVSALVDAPGANLPARLQSQEQSVTDGDDSADDWSCPAAAAAAVLPQSLQLIVAPVSAAGEVAAPRNAAATGVAVAARPAFAVVPVAVVLVAAAVARQALAVAAD